jgi:hypothetical protein
MVRREKVPKIDFVKTRRLMCALSLSMMNLKQSLLRRPATHPGTRSALGFWIFRDLLPSRGDLHLMKTLKARRHGPPRVRRPCYEPWVVINLPIRMRSGLQRPDRTGKEGAEPG